MEVKADTRNLSEVREFVRQHSREFGFGDKQSSEIELAVDEAFTNIIKHAYSGRKGLPVQLTLLFRKDQLHVSLFDSGDSFEPGSYSKPDIQTLAHEKKKGGMGVYLIQRLMDHVEYRRDDHRNEIRMTKRRSA